MLNIYKHIMTYKPIFSLLHLWLINNMLCVLSRPEKTVVLLTEAIRDRQNSILFGFRQV